MPDRKPSISIISVALLLAATWGGQGDALAAGNSQQVGNAGMSALQNRSYRSDSERLYVEKCAMCHREFGMGTTLLARRVERGKAFLEDRDDLTEDYVIMAAREGVGNMPRIPRGEVSDAELRQIARYLAKGNRK